MRLLNTQWLMLAAALTIGAYRGQQAESPPPQDAQLWTQLKVMEPLAASITTVQAVFTQWRYSPLLKEPLKSSGEVFVAEGNTLWHTQQPRETFMLVSAEELRMYYPQENLLEVYDIGRLGGELASSPVPRIEALRTRFSMTSLTMAEKTISVQLAPKDADLAEFVSRVEVRIQRETALAERIEIFDAEGERTVISFTEIKVNEPLPQGKVQLNLPADVRITRPLDPSAGGGHEGGSL
ncbi:MAG: LolA family protein [Phycisphaerales bacterium]